MLTVGIEGKGTVVVAERHTARVRASGTLDVFAGNWKKAVQL